MSISDIENTTKKVKSYLHDDKTKRFGPPGPSHKEESCSSFNAYLCCQGYLSAEKKAINLPPGSTLQDARQAFGRPMRQQKIVDEDGYELDPSSPLWRFSKNCNVSLTFAYARGKEIASATKATGNLLNKTQGCVAQTWRHLTTDENSKDES